VHEYTMCKCCICWFCLNIDMLAQSTQKLRTESGHQGTFQVVMQKRLHTYAAAIDLALGIMAYAAGLLAEVYPAHGTLSSTGSTRSSISHHEPQLGCHVLLCSLQIVHCELEAATVFMAFASTCYHTLHLAYFRVAWT
jgi:hypothetical protein